MSTAHNGRAPLVEAEDALAGAPNRAPAANETPGRRRGLRRSGLHGFGRRAVDRREAAEASLLAERRRVAAELHDLVMQDVSFALGCARAIAADPQLAERHADAAVAAGERALMGAREILGSLASRDRSPLAELLAHNVRIAARDVQLVLELPPAPAREPDQLTCDTLVHIAREAVANAVKHARPTRLEVTLTHEDEWQLTVIDDGAGFDPDVVIPGFGLESMRRHAEALGGRFRLAAEPDGGTRVEVSLP